MLGARRAVPALLLAMAALASLAPARAAAQEDRQRQVLVVYSTRRDAQVALVGERELPRLLENGLNGRLDYYSEFIDPARFSDPAYQTALSVFLRRKYEDRNFDAIVAVGDDATEFVGRNRSIFNGAPPMVFYGSSRALKRPPGATGVVGELDFAATVRLAAALDPQLRHVVTICGADKNDRLFERIVRGQLKVFEPAIEITYLTGLPTAELEGRLRSLPPHSMVFYIVVDEDGDGRYFHPLQYLERVVAAANAPTYSWVDSAMGMGIVGGSLKAQAAQMQAVAEIAQRVLRGEPVDRIPVSVRNLNVTQVDWRSMRRWGFSETRLPAGSVILFRDPTAWEGYRSYILTTFLVLIAQSALIAGLLVHRRQRRKAEDQLLESQAEVLASYDRIRDLGSRLLNAQETERSHIARELHDDVGQQLALVEMDLKLLGSGYRSDADMLSETLGRIRAVSQSLRDLSHRLHPAKLRLIGLVVALNGLQREMSQSGTEVVFTHDQVPSSLPPDLTLCLFRVAQEALQNAIKYSRARRVAMRVAGGDGTLTLTIDDDGIGFDIPAMWGKGLGLVSMMERIEAVGGDLKVRSSPGLGTSLEAIVPLASEQAGSVAV